MRSIRASGWLTRRRRVVAEAQRSNDIKDSDVGRNVRIKHTRITEGRLVKIHYSMSDMAVLYDIEKPDGTVRRISHETIMQTKDLGVKP